MDDLDSKISNDDVKKHIELCACNNCGFEDELCIDEVVCEDKNCRQCGSKMTTSLNQQNESLIGKINKEKTVEGKFKILTENTGSFNIPKRSKIAPLETTTDNSDKRLFNRLEETDVLNKRIDYKNKYHCDDCGIVISASIYEHDGICPKCGKDFVLLENKEFLDNERRFICPGCSASYKYTKITEDVCSFCNSLMTVFGKPVIKNSKTPLPID